jgi:DNA polymerase III epsilon subunit family exonuclease
VAGRDGMDGAGPGVPAVKMSVGGSTVVFVRRPSVTARADEHGYGEGPLARPELTLVKPTVVDKAEAGNSAAGSSAGISSAEATFAEGAFAEGAFAEGAFAESTFAELEFAELEFAVIDLETTGWSPGIAAITEIAAVRVRGGRRQGEFASLVNPGVPVPPGIEDLTGISDWMLAAAPRLPAVLPGLLDFADGCVLVAHNAPFDVGFLRAACAECGLGWPRPTVLDTVMLARQLMDPDEVPDCKLGTLAGFFRARTAPSHRALADARATADVLGWLIRRLTHHGIRTLGQLRDWPDVVTLPSA